jgi:hypothetical protein
VLKDPKVQEKYNECLNLIQPKELENFNARFCKKFDGKVVNQDTVLAEIHKLKEAMGRIQTNKIEMPINISSSVLSDEKCNVGGEQDIRQQIKSMNITTASKGWFAKVSNAKRPSIPQNQQNSHGSMR